MSAARFASTAVNSSFASFAVLRFEPAATMPPSDRERQDRRIKRDSAYQHGDENRAPARDGDLSGKDEFAAALDRGSKFIDLLLEAHDFVAIIDLAHK
jgi:hypothetical protein